MSGIKRDNLDKLFSHYIRARAGWKCECCGRMDIQLDCAHLVGRRYKHVRVDPAAALCLCRNCHEYFTDFPKYWDDWTRGYLGSDHVDAVYQRAQCNDTITPKDREEIADDLYEKVKALGEKPVCTGRKRAKKKTAKKKARAKVNSGKYRKKVSGEVVER